MKKERKMKGKENEKKGRQSGMSIGHLQDACFCWGEVEKNMGSRVGGGEKLESGKRGVMRMAGKVVWWVNIIPFKREGDDRDGTIDWKIFKQSTTAISAIEAEYITASEASMKAVWIRKFISGLGIVPTINEPIKMLCDNLAALLIANEPGVQRGAIHYHRRYHYVRECIELGEINLLKIRTYEI
nr:retrovirus-related Pol polyprotein from transposon TNT 1-94 [Tanacetum cinerariifolium]